MDESAQEKEERLTRREERLERQHNRIMESRNAPARNPSGGSGGFLGGIGAFIGDHKIAVIAVAVIVVFLSIITALKKQSGATNANTANQSPNYGSAGYQTSGEATAFQQLGQQLNNVQSQLTALQPTSPSTTTTVTPNVEIATLRPGGALGNSPISLRGDINNYKKTLIGSLPFGSKVEVGQPVTGQKTGEGTNVWYPVMGGGYVSAFDVTNIAPAYQAPSISNASTVTNNTTSSIFQPGSYPTQAIVLQQQKTS